MTARLRGAGPPGTPQPRAPISAATPCQGARCPAPSTGYAHTPSVAAPVDAGG
jgi:hypothetical protein